MLSLDRLRYLVEVDRRGSISAAATALHITPSAVSQQLRALSKSVGCDIVQSLSTGTTCTPAGRILVDHAVRAMAALEQAEESLHALRGERPEELSLACFPSAVASLLPTVFSRMNSEYPALRLKFEILGSHLGIKAIAAGDVDVALIATYPNALPIPHGFPSAVLGQDALQLVLPRAHPLAGATHISVDDLRDEPLLMEGEHSPSFLAFLDVCRAQRIEPVIRAHIPDAGVAVAMAADGLGIAAIPRLAIGFLPESVVVRGMSPHLLRELVLVCRPEKAALSPARSLVSIAKSVCDSLAGTGDEPRVSAGRREPSRRAPIDGSIGSPAPARRWSRIE